jgi:MFS family permease
LIADLTSDNKRGKIFGRVQSALLVGMFCSLLIAGNVANPYVGNIPGWRFLFAGGGVVAFIVALGLGGFLTEPPHQLDESAKVKGCAAVRTELCTVLSFLRIPTFCVMIMQGVFGTIP